MLEGLKLVLDTFGANVFVPLVIFVVAKILKVTTKKAAFSAMSAAVGLMGFTMLIGAYGPIITPIIEGMVTNAGVQLPTFDIGWPATSVIAYSTELGILGVGIILGLQVVLFLLKVTNVFQPTDLWNNYSLFCFGSMAYVLTGNFWIGLIVMIVMMLYTQVFSEMIQKRWSTYYKYPNCVLASLHTVSIAPFAIGMDYVLNKFGLYKIKADPASLKSKIGLMGEPMFLGLFLGLGIGIIGNINALGELATWGTIVQAGIATSAVMSVFPKVSGIFSGAFTALTDASRKTISGMGSDREWYLSVNDATGYGETATLLSGLLLMPIVLILAFILPGNSVLPLIDLVAIPYCIQPIVACSNGNVAKTIVSGTLWFALALYAGTFLAPAFTEVALAAGVDIGVGTATMITSFCIVCQPVATLILYPFITANYVLMALVIVVLVVLRVGMYKFKPVLHDHLEQQASLE